MMIEPVPNHRYGGWPNCVRLANREVEVIVTADVGPRVIRYGPLGGPNLFHEVPEELGTTGGERFKPYGGHRLWHAPEDPVRTYAPDNGPVGVSWNDPWLVLTAPVEAHTGVEKRLALRLARSGSGLDVRHHLTNRGPWTIELAAWALTVLRPGGVAIVPNEPFVPFPEQLGPARPLITWPYTSLDDPRLHFGARYTFVRQDPHAERPIKLGAAVTEGWAAYLREGLLFVKESPFWEPERDRYPDFGASVELFTNADFIELETLSPLTRLVPGMSLDHEERWRLWTEVPPIRDDDDADRELRPRLVAP